jgi:Na+/H+ antiporter NhaC
MASASDHIDHVKTQIPYSLTVAAIAVLVGYLPAAMFGINPLISLVLGFACCYGVVRFVGKEVEEGEADQKAKAKAS